jgi:hypothetical protein
MVFSNDGVTYSTPADVYGRTKSWALDTAGGGTKTVYVKFKDYAGNWSAPSSDTIIFDTAFPSTTAAAAGYTFGSWTNSGSVSVTLSVNDGSSSGLQAGYPKYCIDTTNTCMPSTPYISGFDIVCASGTSCTHYVRYYARNNAFNTETVKSSVVMQDLQAPTDGSLSGTPASTAINLSWSAAMDLGGGVSYYKLVYQTGGTPPADCSGTAIYSGSGLSYNHTGLSSSSPFSYRVCAYDAANNLSSGATLTATTLDPISTYTITFSPTGSGTIVCTPTAVSADGSFECTLSPGSGYHLASLLDNTLDVTTQVSGNLYTVTNVSSDHNIQATFQQNLVLRLWGSSGETWYSDIQSAYNAATSGDAILTLASVFDQELNFNRDVSISLFGGSGPNFDSVTGWTVINGNLTISNGTVIIENLVLK